jgi:uncharacterized protein (TIGR00251 family)
MEPAATCQLEIRAVPNAAHSEVVGWLGDALKVKIKAPPVDGKANAELCRFLAAELGLPKGSVTLTRGASSRQKCVAINGLTRTEVLVKLGG